MPDVPAPNPEFNAVPDPLMSGPPGQPLLAPEVPHQPHLPSQDRLIGIVDDLQSAPQPMFDDSTVDKFSHLMDQASMPEPMESPAPELEAMAEPTPVQALEQMDAPPPVDAQPELQESPMPELPPVPKWDETPVDDTPLPEYKAPDVSEAGVPSSIPDLELFDTPEINVMEEPKVDSFKKLQDDFKTLNKPLFVKMDDFSQIVDSINAVNTTLRDSDKIFYRLKELKEIREKKLEDWRKSLEEIQRKLVYLDNKVFEVL